MYSFSFSFLPESKWASYAPANSAFYLSCSSYLLVISEIVFAQFFKWKNIDGRDVTDDDTKQHSFVDYRSMTILTGTVHQPGWPLPMTSNTKKLKLTQSHDNHEAVATNDKRGIHHPPKLFSICVQYVSENLTLVESLVDFPDEIGKQIFETARAPPSVFVDAPHLVDLFCKAYGNLLLSKLSLRACHLVLGTHLEYFTIFVNITHLDLSECSLGTEHDVFDHFAKLRWWVCGNCT